MYTVSQKDALHNPDEEEAVFLELSVAFSLQIVPSQVTGMVLDVFDIILVAMRFHGRDK